MSRNCEKSDGRFSNGNVWCVCERARAQGEHPSKTEEVNGSKSGSGLRELSDWRLCVGV